MKQIEIPVNYEFLGLSSYGNQLKSSGEVRVSLDLHDSVEGKNILIIEDIVDSGLTLKYIQNYFSSRKPLSIRTCALLVKPGSIQTDVQIDYSGFDIGGEFVVGYGIDFNQKYRNLPYIGYLEKEI
jgi:hypoxanthine phosphoribosyltransferase